MRIGPGLIWAPALVLGVGAVFTTGVDLQRTLPLRAPLSSTVPQELLGYAGRDTEIPEQEIRVAGVDSYLLRDYAISDSALPAFSVYIGYYQTQTQGRTIHSPKNCLPGAGWEALASAVTWIPTSQGPVAVNRYTLQREDAQALVLYWYQGRGRVEANEYRVKWHLLKDAAVRRRTDEALVRVVVPIRGDEASAVTLAEDVARALIPPVSRALPEG
jgi:EpsI family protein